MSDKRKQTGAMGERIACEYLRERGYKIVDQNYRTRGGEIDIIAEGEGMTIFVEVKTRRSRTFGFPEEAIDRRKQLKIARTAENYLAVHHLYDVDYRIDSIGIELGADDKIAELRHEKDVVGW